MSWYAVITLSGEEEKLTAYMQKKFQLTVIFPKVERHFRIQKQDILAIKPLSVGCVFVECEDFTPYFKQVKEICSLQRYHKISQEDAQVLCSLMDEQHIIRMSKGILVDHMPVVKEGPLCGYEKEIVKINTHKRIAELAIQLNDRTILTGLEIMK